MKYIKNSFSSPALSLAAEEFILENYTSGECLMLWRSPPSVIVGKFQNPYEEVSLIECDERGVGIFRRNSGGGTVYHDLGNVNFSLFRDHGEACDYPFFLSPIVDFLNSLGAEAYLGENFDIRIGGKKVSGNAQSVHRGRMMHHGTLLFDVQLGSLRSLTGHAREKIISKSIKSKPSEVANIKNFLPSSLSGMSVCEFEERLITFLACGEQIELSSDEICEIERISAEKYSSWEWNFGRSPAFELESEALRLKSKGGVILSCEFCGMMKDFAEAIGQDGGILVGTRLIYGEIFDVLHKFFGEDIAKKITVDILG